MSYRLNSKNLIGHSYSIAEEQIKMMNYMLLTFSAPVASSTTQFSLKQVHIASRSSAFSKRSDCFCNRKGKNVKTLHQLNALTEKTQKYSTKKERIGTRPLKTGILPAFGPCYWWILLQVSKTKENTKFRKKKIWGRNDKKKRK